MFKTLSAAILSIALALPATTAPARADANDVAKVLGGLAALYILKEALEKDRARAHTVHRAPVHRPQVHRPHRNNNKVIPARCFRQYDTRRGVVQGYGARCMQNRVARPGVLPPNCIRQVRLRDNRNRNFYAPRCLRRNGWATARASR